MSSILTGIKSSKWLRLLIAITMLSSMLTPFAPASPAFAATRTTRLTVTAASGTYGQTAALQALFEYQQGANWTVLSGFSITFTINGSGFISNTVVTDNNGIARIAAAPLATSINAGTYASGVQANFEAVTVSPHVYTATSNTASLTVAKASATLTLGNLSHTYNGSAKAATVTTSPSGLTGVSLSYSQGGMGVSSPTNAGTYSATATLSNTNYLAPNAVGDLIIAKANQTITFGSLAAKTFGDAPFTVSATSNSTLPVSFTALGQCSVSGTTVSIAGAGSCTITAAQAGNSNYNAAASVPQTFNIAKATAGVTLSNLTPIYSGTPQGATITTTPGGLPVTVTYDGSSTLPTNAGSYAVIATVNHPNYQGSANGTLVIARANATITLDSLGQVYNGSPRSVTANTTPSGLSVSITYNGSGTAPTNAGTYPVAAVITDPNYQGSANDNLIIERAPQTITFGDLGDKTFGDAPFTVAATSSSGLPVLFTASGQCTRDGATVTITGAGICTITASQAGNSNYNAAVSVPQTFNIFKAPATIALSNLSQTYNGSANAVGITTSPPNLNVVVTYAGSSIVPKDAGSYAVLATINEPNYTGSQMGTLVISQASQTITFGALTNKTFGDVDFAVTAASDAPLAVTFTASGQCIVIGSNVHLTGAGGCIITAKQAGNSNYTPAADVQQSFSISKGTATISLGTLAFTYNGSSHGLTPSTTPAGLTVNTTYSQNSMPVGAPTNAGSYDVLATISDNNYQGSITDTLVIRKADQLISFTPLTDKTFGDTNFSASATSNSTLPVSFTALGQCSVSGTTVSIAGAGSCTITAAQAGNSNYNAAASVPQTFNIAKATAGVTLSNLARTYSGMPQGAAVTTNPASLPITITYNGSSTAPTNAGSYAVSVVVNHPNYEGSAQGTLVIARLGANITLENLSATYDGSPKIASANTSPANLPVAITYNGSTTPPTNAGSYAVLANLTDPNHEGTITGTLLIAKANQVIDFAALGAKTYQDADFELSAIGGASGNPVTFAAVGNCTVTGINVHITGAGSCTITAAQAGNSNYNAATSVGRTFSIAKKRLDVSIGGLTPTYNAQPHGVVVGTTESVAQISVTYDGSAVAPTNAGTYTVVATIVDPNYMGSAEDTLTINKADQSIILGTLTDKTWGDADIPVSAMATSGLPVSLVATGQCNLVSNNGTSIHILGAGGCSISASQVGNSNYNPALGVGGSFTIAKQEVNVLLGSLDFIYNGMPRGTTAATSPVDLQAQYISLSYSGSEISPINAGSYAVEATVNHPNYKGSAQGTLVIARADAVITLDDVSHVYDGTIKTASAKTTPGGLGHTITYSQTGALVAEPIYAGSYAIEAVVTDTNYLGSIQGTLVIAPASQQISFAELANKTYEDADFTVSATGGASGNPVTFVAVGNCTVNGASVHITGAGSCTITASQAGNSNYNPAPVQPQTFNIAKKVLGVTLDGVIHTYDRNPHAVVASTNRPVQNIEVTYEGSETAPTNAGSYTVVATIVDDNYEGTARGTLLIQKADQEITFGTLANKTFGNPDFSVSATSDSGLPVNLVASGKCSFVSNNVHILGAGGCSISASQLGNDNYNAASGVTQNFTVNKAAATLQFGNLQYTYNGTPHNAPLSTTPSGLSVGVTYDGFSTIPTNAGSYAIEATVNDANYEGSTQGTLVISVAGATITLNTLAHTYSGSPKSANASTNPLGLSHSISHSQNGIPVLNPTDAGSYAVSALITNPNYQGSVQDILVISKADQTINFASINNKTYAANGASDFMVSVTGGASGNPVTFAAVGNCNITGTTVHITGAGSCTITASQAGNNNYNPATPVVQSFTINKAVAAVTLGSLQYTYNGTPYGTTATTNPSGLATQITYNGATTAPTSAGSYAVVATINDVNYEGSTTNTLIISKANQTINFGFLTHKTFGDPNFTLTSTGGLSGNPVTYGVVGDCSVSGSTVSLVSKGGCTITASQAGNNNYLPANNVSQSFNIAGWRFDGPFSPVNMTPGNSSVLTYNTINGGSTVPLKFNVFMGNTRLTNTNIIEQPLKVYQCGCASGQSGAPATATGGTSLRYDTSGQQFIFNWQTPNASNTCYKVTIQTKDGSESPIAYFRTR
jgi:hypothetical protein